MSKVTLHDQREDAIYDRYSLFLGVDVILQFNECVGIAALTAEQVREAIERYIEAETS